MTHTSDRIEDLEAILKRCQLYLSESVAAYFHTENCYNLLQDVEDVLGTKDRRTVPESELEGARR